MAERIEINVTTGERIVIQLTTAETADAQERTEKERIKKNSIRLNEMKRIAIDAELRQLINVNVGTTVESLEYQTEKINQNKNGNGNS